MSNNKFIFSIILIFLKSKLKDCKLTELKLSLKIISFNLNPKPIFPKSFITKSIELEKIFLLNS